MSGLNLPKLYQTQISQTEWLGAISHDQTEAFRAEDNDKRERLRRLNELIDLPFDRPYQFSAQAVTDRTPEFVAFLKEHGDELCAMRLMSRDPALPKLRTRGRSIRDTLTWYDQQAIDPTKYRVDFVPHQPNVRWATIFIVNNAGAFGEIIAGTHAQLTQGLYESEPPLRFTWDQHQLTVTPAHAAAQAHLQDILSRLRVSDASLRAQLTTEIAAEFAGEYLKGYFETTTDDEFGLWFIDYNRILGHMYDNFIGQSIQDPASDPETKSSILLTGQAGSAGIVTGRVRVVSGPSDPDFQDGEILVCAAYAAFMRHHHRQWWYPQPCSYCGPGAPQALPYCYSHGHYHARHRSAGGGGCRRRGGAVGTASLGGSC
jgi:hypothetical protein